MSEEKRRFFRINENIGFTYEWLDSKASQPSPKEQPLDRMLAAHDAKIERLLREVRDESPKVAELVLALNQKIERLVQQALLDNQMVSKIANKVREVNISACGMGFVNDQEAEKGRHMRCELELAPQGSSILTKGILVACDPHPNGYFWRIDFYGMSQVHQELLIQHIVQRQSAQLRQKRGDKG